MFKKSAHIQLKTGMTLLEIVVAMAIFAIIMVGFYGMFSTVFINMYKTSKVTENAFLTQQAVEGIISDVKLKIKNGIAITSSSEVNPQTINLFTGTNSRTVDGYKVTKTMINGKSVETFIASNRPPVLKVPVITSAINIAAFRGSNIEKYPNIASKNSLVINLIGGKPTVDNEGLLIQHLYYWYISKPGIYTLSQPPLFPDDYEILAGYTAKDILTIPDSFSGRFFKLVVTPVGEKGQMGDAVVSNDLFISPLPVYSSLLLHYDASWINKLDSAEFSSNLIQKWVDIGPNINAVTALTGSKPMLIPGEYGKTTSKRTFGVKVASSGSQILVTGANKIPAKSNITIYFIANFSSTNGDISDTNILYTNNINASTYNKFVLKTNTSVDALGQLELVKYLNSNSNPKIVSVVNETRFRTDAWEIIKLELYTNQIAIRHGVLNTNDVYSFVNNKVQTLNSTNTMTMTPFTMNLSQGYSIGEVMIYDGIVTNVDEQKILKYLAEKYLP